MKHLHLLLLLPPSLLSVTGHQKHTHKHFREKIQRCILREFDHVSHHALYKRMEHAPQTYRSRVIHSAVHHNTTRTLKRILRVFPSLIHTRNAKGQTLLQHAQTRNNRIAILKLQRIIKHEAQKKHVACPACFTPVCKKRYRELFVLPSDHHVVCTACVNNWDPIKQRAQDHQELCPICLDPVTKQPHKNLNTLSCCNHVLCRACKENWETAQNTYTEYIDKDNVTCPICRAPMR